MPASTAPKPLFAGIELLEVDLEQALATERARLRPTVADRRLPVRRVRSAMELAGAHARRRRATVVAADRLRGLLQCPLRRSSREAHPAMLGRARPTRRRADHACLQMARVRIAARLGRRCTVLAQLYPPELLRPRARVAGRRTARMPTGPSPRSRRRCAERRSRLAGEELDRERSRRGNPCR
jgi:hypothetical protein